MVEKTKSKKCKHSQNAFSWQREKKGQRNVNISTHSQEREKMKHVSLPY